MSDSTAIVVVEEAPSLADQFCDSNVIDPVFAADVFGWDETPSDDELQAMELEYLADCAACELEAAKLDRETRVA